jgi:hypothetical protein
MFVVSLVVHVDITVQRLSKPITSTARRVQSPKDEKEETTQRRRWNDADADVMSASHDSCALQNPCCGVEIGVLASE